MDKRKAANQKVKRNITEALFALMREKNFHDITITELVSRAKVARASFYRNYSTKEDVMQNLVDDVLAEFRKEAITGEDGSFYCYENVKLSFVYFSRYRQYFVDMCEADFAGLLLTSLNQFHEEAAGTMPATSVERYQLYMYMGALLNTAAVWMWSGQNESIEDLTNEFCRFIGIPIPENNQ